MVGTSGVGGQPFTTLGPVRVRLEGTTKAGEDGEPVPSVTVPNEAEARVALDRAARVNGADGVLRASSDYRRAAVAAGLQVRVEVQAWGTAFQYTAEEEEPR